MTERDNIPADPQTGHPLITIYSFGFRKSGIPVDPHGHGGGYVFDCRGLPNPGRESEFAQKTGQDKEVAAYLERYSDVNAFFKSAMELITLNAGTFQHRHFDHMMVAFGCTGGQHRSVYFAERAAKELRAAGYSVKLVHIDKPDFGS